MTDATLPPVLAGTPTVVDKTVVTCPQWWSAPQTLHTALQALGRTLAPVMVHVRSPRPDADADNADEDPSACLQPHSMRALWWTQRRWGVRGGDPGQQAECPKAWVALAVPLAAVRAAAGVIPGPSCAQPMFTVLLVRVRQGVVRMRLTKSAVGGGDVRLRRALQAAGHALASGTNAQVAFARAIQGIVRFEAHTAWPLLTPQPSLQGDCFLAFMLKQAGKETDQGPRLKGGEEENEGEEDDGLGLVGAGWGSRCRFHTTSTVQTVLSTLLQEPVASVLACKTPTVCVGILLALRDMVLTTPVSPTVLVFAALALHTLHTASMLTAAAGVRDALVSCSRIVLMAVDTDMERGGLAPATNTASLETQTARALLRQVVPFHVPSA
jgi:hypothetical protein